VDALVLKGGSLLLVKRALSLSEGGKWALVGGFMERDETIRQAAAREVLEETGYEIGALQLLTIRDNPGRPREDRQNIVFVFFCEAGEKVGKPDWESTAQDWFPLDSLPNEELVAFDHYADIELYLDYKKGKIEIPIMP
jgi:ADP-ribose pyrophosphatase YjhB (NUDIX family)